MSPRKQLQIKGTERTEYPEVEKAAAAYVVVRDERSELSKREAQKKLELLAVMRAHKIAVYKFFDEDGEEVVARVDEGDPKVSVKKTGEAESEVGQGVADPDEPPAGMAGLIAEAERAQDAANVVETAEGDVVPTDKAAPKKKRGKKS